MDLKTLTEINAPSGHEQAIRRFLLDELKKLGFTVVKPSGTFYIPSSTAWATSLS